MKAILRGTNLERTNLVLSQPQLLEIDQFIQSLDLPDPVPAKLETAKRMTEVVKALDVGDFVLNKVDSLEVLEVG